MGRGPYNQPFFYKGREYRSLTVFARMMGVDAHLIRTRVRHGCPEDKLLEPSSHNLGFVDHTGQRFASFSAMARSWGLEPHLVYDRIFRYGWDRKTALTAPVQSRGTRPDNVKIFKG